jgi:hypothetical protein
MLGHVVGNCTVARDFKNSHSDYAVKGGSDGVCGRPNNCDFTGDEITNKVLKEYEKGFEYAFSHISYRLRLRRLAAISSTAKSLLSGTTDSNVHSRPMS